MAGVFHSLVTQGHVSINRLLSTARSYLGLLRSGGQRIFVELEDGCHLLDLPSAYEMAPNGCRWLYKHCADLIQVRSWAPVDRHALHLSIEVLAGAPCRFLIAHHVAINGDDGADAIPVQFTPDGNGVVIRPPADCDVGRRFPQGFFRIDMGDGTTVERIGGDEPLFVDGRSRRQPFVSVLLARTASAQLPDHGAPAPRRRTPRSGAHTGSHCRRGRGRTVLAEPAGAARSPPGRSRRRRRRSSTTSGNRPVVRAQCYDSLPRPARTGAVLRRRLGNPRRLPWPGRVSAGARPMGPAARPPAASVPDAEP